MRIRSVHHEGAKDTKVRNLSLFLRALRVLRGELSFPNFAFFAPFAVNYPILNFSFGCGFAALAWISHEMVSVGDSSSEKRALGIDQTRGMSAHQKIEAQ